MGRFESIPTFPAFDFSGQPSVPGLAAILEGDVCHQLLAAPKPHIRRDKALMGSNHKYLVFQALVFVLLHIPALIEITAVCPGKVGGVIDYYRTLTFEELVHFQVGLRVDRIAK